MNFRFDQFYGSHGFWRSKIPVFYKNRKSLVRVGDNLAGVQSCRRREVAAGLWLLPGLLVVAGQPLQDAAAALEEVLLHRVLEGELLAAVRAAVVGVGLGQVAGEHVAVEFLLGLGPVWAVRAGERPVAVAGDDVALQLGVGPAKAVIVSTDQLGGLW